MQNEAYQKLMDNLCDIVAEEQAKLGYMKEPIRLYYPLSSLNHFLEEMLPLMRCRKNFQSLNPLPMINSVKLK